jgi:hypothetical protein
MGSTRMVIFHEKLLKTEKEQEKIEEKNRETETVEMIEILEHKN